MHEQAIAFTTPSTAPRWQRWLLFSPPARIAIFVAWFVGLIMLAQFGSAGVGAPKREWITAAWPSRSIVTMKRLS